MIVDMDPFPSTTINMILILAECKRQKDQERCIIFLACSTSQTSLEAEISCS